MNNFKLDVVEFNENFELSVIESKEIYNMDNDMPCSEWVRQETKGLKTYDFPQMKSSISVKDDGRGRNVLNHIGYFDNNANSIYDNTNYVFLLSENSSRANGLSIIPKNFQKVCNLFTARKTIQPNWMNCKDEYLAPNEEHPQYQQFSYDSIVYSLFNNSSQQSSLNQIEYKDKLWNIKNEFFWLSKNQMLSLAEENHYDVLYNNAKTADERFVYNLLFVENLYDNLSQEAKDVLDYATDLLVKSITMRKLISEGHPEYHLDCWDCGYAQLKLVWKEYFKDDFKTFREKYKSFEEKMRPMVFELGFLRE